MITQNSQLLSFLNELRKGKIFYRLSQHRDDALMVEVSVPGERWEVEFLDDGSVEVEVFNSDGTIHGEESLNELLRHHAEHMTGVPASSTQLSTVTNASWEPRSSGFPPRSMIEACILQILLEKGGASELTEDSGWTIYDEIAARLQVPFEARQRPTPGTGEPAWRPEVGWARKNLVESGKLESADLSGRGIWKLKK
jgi:hypothetical protein